MHVENWVTLSRNSGKVDVKGSRFLHDEVSVLLEDGLVRDTKNFFAQVKSIKSLRNIVTDDGGSHTEGVEVIDVLSTRKKISKLKVRSHSNVVATIEMAVRTIAKDGK